MKRHEMTDVQMQQAQAATNKQISSPYQSFQSALTSDSKKPNLSLVNTHDECEEVKIAKMILDAKNPVIIINEDTANSRGEGSKYMFDTFPNVPVIFENAKALDIFNKARWCDRKRAKTNIVGHFTKSVTGKEVINTSSVDVVIIFGKPKQDVLETFPNATFVSNQTGQIENTVHFGHINRIRQERMSPQ